MGGQEMIRNIYFFFCLKIQTAIRVKETFTQFFWSKQFVMILATDQKEHN